MVIIQCGNFNTFDDITRPTTSIHVNNNIFYNILNSMRELDMQLMGGSTIRLSKLNKAYFRAKNNKIK